MVEPMDEQSEAESLALLQLNLTPGIGPRLQSLLLGRFETARQIFNASAQELLAVDGIGPLPHWRQDVTARKHATNGGVVRKQTRG